MDIRGPNPPFPGPLKGNSKNPVAARAKKQKPVRGYCEKCGNYMRNLKRVRGMFLCNGCSE